jgi:hypothetical protein
MLAGILEILLGFWASQQFLSVRGALLLGRVLRPVPRHLRDRHRLRSPQPPTRLAANGACADAGHCLVLADPARQSAQEGRAGFGRLRLDSAFRGRPVAATSRGGDRRERGVSFP